MANASQPLSPASISRSPSQGDENVGCLGRTESTRLRDLNESRAELLARVQSLKKDLQEWRGKLDTQVKTYRQELGDLRNTLNVEVEQLRSEFHDLSNSLKKQLDSTSKLAKLLPERLSSPNKNISDAMNLSSPVQKSDMFTPLQIEDIERAPSPGSVKLASPMNLEVDD